MLKYPKRKWGKKPQKKGSSKSYVLKLWADYIKKRDGGVCQLCLGIDRVQAHHICKRGTYINNGWFLVDNGISLCHVHHYSGIHDTYFPRVKETQEKINNWLKKKGISYDSLYVQCKSRNVDLELAKIMLKHLLSEQH